MESLAIVDRIEKRLFKIQHEVEKLTLLIERKEGIIWDLSVEIKELLILLKNEIYVEGEPKT
jgi:hypothetical protein